MMFNLGEIREAVDLAVGDDGQRSEEVVEILKQIRKEDAVAKVDAAIKNNKTRGN